MICNTIFYLSAAVVSRAIIESSIHIKVDTSVVLLSNLQYISKSIINRTYGFGLGELKNSATAAGSITWSERPDPTRT